MTTWTKTNFSNGMKAKVMVQLNEGRTAEIKNRIRSPRDIARMLGVDGFIERAEKADRNRRFMDVDQVEDEEMMNRLADGEDF